MVTEWSRPPFCSLFERGTRPAAASAALESTPAKRWLYVSAVMAIDECPSRLLTMVRSTPAASNSDA